VPNFASDTGNVAGRTTNRGFEGLAISPDGKFAYAILQSAMLDEGAGNGTVNRIVKFDTVTGKAVAQYAYQLDTQPRAAAPPPWWRSTTTSSWCWSATTEASASARP
jgi:hypothetical protein